MDSGGSRGAGDSGGEYKTINHTYSGHESFYETAVFSSLFKIILRNAIKCLSAMYHPSMIAYYRNYRYNYTRIDSSDLQESCKMFIKKQLFHQISVFP